MDFSLFLPFLLGFNNRNPVQDFSPDRIILVIEAGIGKDGNPPASKASIEALQSVEIGEEEEEGKKKSSLCVICLEGWRVGDVAKEMPCQHRFHKECIEKWLGIHGNCPVCRHNLPAEDGDEVRKKSGRSRWRRRGILVGFTVSSDEA